jgi:hypothetical protein
VPRKTSNLTRPPQTDPIHAARGSLRHPGWLRRNHRLASVGTGGWFQSESLAVFIGVRIEGPMTDDRPRQFAARKVCGPTGADRELLAVEFRRTRKLAGVPPGTIVRPVG